MAVSIALRVNTISERMYQSYPNGTGWMYDYSKMSEKVIAMLKMSLDALVNRDAQMARKVFLLDDEVDSMMQDAYDKVRERLRRDSEHPGCLINIYLLARHLERIGDR